MRTCFSFTDRAAYSATRPMAGHPISFHTSMSIFFCVRVEFFTFRACRGCCSLLSSIARKMDELFVQMYIVFSSIRTAFNSTQHTRKAKYVYMHNSYAKHLQFYKALFIILDTGTNTMPGFFRLCSYWPPQQHPANRYTQTAGIFSGLS